jgi:exonuclease SbcC
VLQAKLNAALQARFQAAMTALENNDRSYAASLETNNAEFDEVLLHLEILSGIDSPAELSRERLQMQVGVLQNTLKNGSADMVNRESVYRLLTLPVLLDPVRTGRLEKVLSASTVL